MNAPLRDTARTISSAIADRVVEISVVGALGSATAWLTWWFTPLTVLAAAWWCAVEVRLWRARRAVPVSSPRAARGAIGVVSPAADMPAEPVSAGQAGAGRAGA